MATVWITYALADNECRDVDFIAQELQREGAEVELDRWNISAGNRLWPQIETFICSEEHCDAWMLIATVNSLSSESCKEEFAYALDRALRNRGVSFPVIGLFIGPVDRSLIPTAIRTRLYVSVTDPDWKERIVAAAEGRAHTIEPELVQPFYAHVHGNLGGEKPFAIEVRPRAGLWAPFIAAIPATEKDTVQPDIMIGPRDVPTDSGMLLGHGTGESQDGKLWLMQAGNQATPSDSYYVWCNKLPSTLIFGTAGNGPKYQIDFG